MSKGERVSKYAYISYEKRLKIIHFILEKGYTFQKTATILGIKPSTARMIMKKYRDNGGIFKRRKEKLQPKPNKSLDKNKDKNTAKALGTPKV